MTRLPAALAAALLLLAAPVTAWQPITELPTAQQRLERLDAALLPLYGSLMAALQEDWTETTEDAFLSIVQARAIQGWELVRAVPADECYAGYTATLRVGYALVADSVDSYRASDPSFRGEADAGLLLLGDRATRERSLTTCEGAAAMPAHTPLPTPTVTPGASP